jgi:hypothetical protein
MTIPDMHYHDKSCATCRYFRVWQSTYASAGECLIRGTIGMASKYQGGMVLGWARERYCDLWKKRPRKWSLYVERNPAFYDPYISRLTLLRLWRRLGLHVCAFLGEPAIAPSDNVPVE